MVAIVSGNGLGLHTGSMGALGSRGVFGQASQVRTGEGAYVDASTGNLVLQSLDARLMGVGNDALALRTYNSLGLPTFAHADGWIEGAYRTVTRVDATHLLRTDVDGSTATYTWNSTTQLYEESYSPGEAISTIKANANGTFTWTDGTTAATEDYAGTGLGLISSATDISGNVLTFTYNAANQLIQVKTTDSNGLYETVTYGYTGANLTSITSQLQSGGLSQVTYTYDAQNRLSTVELNLSPDGTAPAGRYITKYLYDGTSNRIASVQQPDGTTVSFTYVLVNGAYKVATFTDGAGKTTTFSYDSATSTTKVTDPLGVTTAYTYDANGQLTLVKLGVTATNPNGLSQVSYTYNSLGDVLSITDGQGRKVAFTYDIKGNLLTQVDDAGDKTVRTYNSLNQLQTDTTYGRVTPWSLANPETVRYVYSATNAALLRFVLTPEGGVTEYRYDARGQRTATIQYTAGTYAVSGLGTSAVPTEAQLTTWVGTQDLSQAERTDYAYDFRGQLQTSTTWTSLDGTGAGVAGTGLATQYVYDPMGRLVKTISADGKRITQVVYDGLGRELSRTVSASDGSATTETTLTSYDDAHGKTTLTTADGLLSVVSTFDGRGRLVSVLQSTGSTALGTTTYAYDADGRLLMATDPTGVRSWNLYDAEGRKVADIDSEGTLTEYVYDASDRLTQTIRYATAVDVTSLVDGSGNPTAPALSSIRPTATAQDQKAWTLYDAAGRAAWQVDALGYVTQTDYDGAGRVQGTTRFATPIDVTKLGNGVGVSLATAGTTEVALAGDVTGDGKADLVFASAQGDGLHLRTRVSNGDGTWTYKDFLVGDGSGVFQTPTLMGDVSGDGKKDLVFIYTAADGIHVRTKISLGTGAWTSKEQILTGDATQVANPVRIGDVNGDGKADLVFTYMVGNDLHVRTLMGNGDGTYVSSEQVFTAEGSGYLATPALMGDFTGDGKADLVFTWFDGTNLHIRTKASNGDGTWTSSEQTFADDGTSLSKPVLVGDINGDGKADLLFTTLGGTNTLNLRTKLSGGNGTWTSQSYLAGDGNLALGGQAQLADINGDGKADLVYEWTDASNNLHVRSRTWNADGTWTYREEVTAADSLTLSKPVLVGDFSGDGKADLAFISYDATSALTVRTKISTGTAWSTSVGTSSQVLTSTTADRTTTVIYDRDGRVRATIDGEGYLTEHIYDAAGREVQTKRYATKVPGFTSAASIATKVSVARNADALTTYNSSTNPNGILPTADPANDISTFTYYDDAGRVVGQVDAESYLTETSYDAGGRVSQVIRYAKPAVGTPTTTSTLASLRPAADLEDQKTTYAYDALGRLSQLTNPEGTITAYTYDVMDRVTKVVVGLNTADARTDLKQYDAQGHLTAELSGNGFAQITAGMTQTQINTVWASYATKYAYDAAGRRISQTDPEGGRTVWFYDDAGRVTHQVDPTGKVTETAYDALGHVSSTTVYATAVSGTALAAMVGGVLSATANAAAVNALAAAKAGATADVYTGTQSVRVWHRQGNDSSIAKGVGTFQAGDVVTATVRFKAAVGTKAQISLGGGTTALVYATADGTGEWQTLTVSVTVAANGTAIALNLYGNRDYTTDNSQSVIYDDVAVTSRTASTGQTVQVLQDGFENGLAGWTTATGASVEVLTASTPTTYSGAKSARVWHRTGTNSDLHRRLATTFQAGEKVTAKVWFKAKAGTSGVVFIGTASRGVTARQAVVGNGDWQQITVTLTMGATAEALDIYLYGDNYSTTSANATDVDSVLYDDVSVVTDQRGVVFQEGFDGGVAAWSVAGQTDSVPALAVGSSRSNETTSYQYDVLGRLVQVTEAELGTTTTSYDAFNGVSRIQSILAGQTVTTTSAYDRRGLLTSTIQDATGLQLTTATTYDAFGRVVSYKDANLKTTTTAYDQLGRVVTVTDPLNQARTATYDAFGRVLTRTDELGRTTTYAYSTSARSMTVTTPEGVAVTTAHNVFGQTVTVKDGNNVTTTYQYDLDGNLTSTSVPVTDGAGATTTVSTTNTYDKADRLLTTTDPDGHVVALRYDAAGRVLTRTVDPGGLNLTTSYVYDGKGRQVGVIDPSGTVTQYTYDREGHVLTQVQDPGGLNLTTTYTYDDQGHVLTVTSPGNTVTQYVYDALGRRIQTIVDPGTGKLNLTTTYAYDANGNVVSVKDPNGNFTRYAYDADNRLVYTVDGAGGVVRTDYDKAGRVAQVIRYAKALTAANLTSLATNASLAAISGMAVATSGSDIVENRVYDKDGRLTYVVDGAGGMTKYTYDANGNVVDRVQYATAISRSAWLTGQGWSATAGTPCAALAAPTVTADSKRDAEVRTVYDSLGRALYALTNVGDGTKVAVVAMAYDAKGNLVSRTAYANTVPAATAATINGVSGALGQVGVKDSTSDQVTRYVYDAADRMVYTLTSVDKGDQVALTSLTYDKDGNLTGRTLHANTIPAATAATSAGVVAALATYRSTAADQTTRYVYDAANRVTAVLNTYWDGTKVSVVTQSYDGNGNLLKRTAYATAAGIAVNTALASDTQLQAAITAVTAAPSKADMTTAYVYDAAGRATAVLSSLDDGTKVAVTTLTYDAAGHVLSRTADATAVTLTTVATPTCLAVATAAEIQAAVSSAQGSSSTSDQVTRYVYDAAGRLNWSVDALGGATKLVYDGLGNVVDQVRYAKPINVATWLTGWTAGNPYPAPTVTATTAADTTHDQEVRTVYDTAGRAIYTLSSTEDGTKVAVVGQTYDAKGNVITRRAYAKAILAPASTSTASQLLTAAQGAATDTTDAVVSRTYDAANRLVFSVDGVGAVTRQVFDGIGNLVKQVAYAKTVAVGSVLAPDYTPVESAGQDRTSLMAYDTAGRLTYTIDALGAVTQTVYDAKGNAVQRIAWAATTTAPTAGVAPRRAEDLRTAGYLAKNAGASDRMTRMAYDAGNQLIFTVASVQLDPLQPMQGIVTRTFYDALGHATATVAYAAPMSAANLTALAAIDAAATNPVALVSDIQSKLPTPLDPANDRTSVRAYDAAGRQIYAVDALGYVTENQYDALGQVTKTTRYATATSGLVGSTILTGYSAVPTLFTVRAKVTAVNFANPAIDRSTWFGYDAAGRLTSSTDALGTGLGTAGHTETYTYDALGNKRSFTNKLNATWNYDYDAAGRMLQQTDPAVDVTAVSQNLDGGLQLGATSSRRVVTQMSYDALGNLLTRTEGGLLKTDGSNAVDLNGARVTQYGYDAMGHQIRITYPQVGVYDTADANDPVRLNSDGAGSSARAEISQILSTRVVYNSFGEAVANVDVAGNVSVKTYDQSGRVRHEVDALGYVTRYDRNAFGEATAVTRYATPPLITRTVNGTTLTNVLLNGGVSTSDWSTVVTNLQVDGALPPNLGTSDRIVQTVYDQLGRTIQVMTLPSTYVNNGNGSGTLAAAITRTTYNAFGEVFQSKVLSDAPAFNTTTNDPGAGATWAFTTRYYDRNGRETGTVDPLGYLTTRTYDSEGNVTGQTEFANSIVGWNPAAPPATLASATTIGAGPFSLALGQSLVVGQSLYSTDGRYQLSLQNGGTLVLVDRLSGVSTWRMTVAGADTLTLQASDGSLVLTKSTTGGPVTLWTAGTTGTGASSLKIQADGSVVLNTAGGNTARVLSNSPTTPYGITLTASHPLAVGESLYSGDGRYQLRLQEDGNLILTDRVNNLMVWNSNTAGSKAVTLVLRSTDGDLVLTKADGTVVWDAGSAGKGGAVLTVRTDGSLAQTSTGGTVVWTSTDLLPGQSLQAGRSLYSTDGHYQFTLRADGNLVISDRQSGAVVWSSNTDGSGATSCALNADGSFVLKNAYGDVLWNSGTGGKGGTKLVMRTDGTLSLIKADGSEAWNSARFMRGQTLKVGQSLYSSDGHYELTLRSDGVLAEYDRSSKSVIWSTSTQNSHADLLTFDASTGELVLTAAGTQVWSAGSAGKNGTRLTLQVDGKLAMYTDAGGLAWSNSVGLTPWSYTPDNRTTLTLGQTPLAKGKSLVSADGRYQLTLQADGNLVLSSRESGAVLWNSDTAGSGAEYLYFFPGGTLSLTKGNDVVVKTLATNNSGVLLTVQADGNLALTSSAGAVVWSSGVSSLVGNQDRVTSWAYDQANRKISEVHQGIVYGTASGTLSASTSLMTASYTYDALGNLIRTLDADGNSTNTVYDAQGRITAVSEPTRGNSLLTPVTKFFRDAFGKVVAQVQTQRYRLNANDDPMGALGGTNLPAAGLPMSAGQSFAVGQSLYSSDGRFQLTLVSGGNLTLTDRLSGATVWTSGTGGSSADTATFQANGDLVLTKATAGGPVQVWNAGTGGRGGTLLTLRADGNLVVTNGNQVVVGIVNGAVGSYASTLTNGQSLGRGQSIYSPDGHYQLTLQDNGALILVNRQTGEILWSPTPTYGSSAITLSLKGDGTLVLGNAHGPSFWSATCLTTGAVVKLQNDGRLVFCTSDGTLISAISNNAAQTPVTYTNTLGQNNARGASVILNSADGHYQLTLKTDGDLVVTDSYVGDVLWTSNTAGKKNVKLTLDGTGNLILWDGTTTFWSTGTAGGTTLTLQNDGNLVLTNSANAAIWSSYRSGSTAGSYADRVTLTRYDSHGNAIQIEDANGSNTYMSYDELGRVAKTWQPVTGNDGVARAMYAVFQYDAAGRQTAIITPASINAVSGGQIITQTQDVAGSVIQAMTYNGFGEMVQRVTSTKSGVKDSQTNQYIVTTHATETFEYDGAGHLWRTKGTDGVTKVFLYDLQGRQTSQITSAGYVGDSSKPYGVDLSSPSFTSAQTVAALGNTGVRRTDSRFDLLGRVTRITLPQRADNSATPQNYAPVVDQVFDRWGNMVAQTTPYRLGVGAVYTTLCTYDANNKLIQQVQPEANGQISSASPTTQMYYDKLGRLVATRDANGHLNAQAWDGAGQLVKEFHADGGVVTHLYDGFGEQVQLTDAMGHVTRYGYDRMGRNTAITHVNVEVAGVSVVNYVVSNQTGQNLTTTMIYDEAGRKTRQYDGSGLDTDLWSNENQVLYTYDLRGNVIATTDALQSVTMAAFDGLGHQVASLDGNGSLSKWNYDAQGVLRSHENYLGTRVDDYTTVTKWDARARQTYEVNVVTGYHFVYGTSAYQTVTYTYDNAFQMVTQVTVNTTGGTVPASATRTFGYDAAGQLVKIVDQSLQQTTTVGYDAAGRHVAEKTVQVQSGASVTFQDQTLSYDALGRLVRVQGSADMPGAVKAGVDVQYTYDQVGNKVRQINAYQTSQKVVTYPIIGYDTYGQPIYGDTPIINYQVNDHAQTLYYAYDAMNRQILVDGAVNADATDLANVFQKQGHILGYDLNGNRVSDTSYGTKVLPVYRSEGYDSYTGEPIQTFVGYANQAALSTTWYTYDQMDRLSTVSTGAFDENGTRLDASLASVLDVRKYDMSSRVVSTGPQGLDSRYIAALTGSNSNLSGAVSTVTLYLANGQVNRQRTINMATNTTTDTGYTYDGAGNMVSSSSMQGTLVSSSTLSLVKFEGYKEKSDFDYMNNLGTESRGTVTSTYDANGYLLQVTSSSQSGDNRTLVNDAWGHVLRKTQGDQSLNVLVANGQVLGYYGFGVDPNYPSVGNGTAPSLSELGNFDLAYEPVTNSYPAPATGQYPVQSGDTLESIALASYGDSDLWYLIAQANGLSGDSDLRVGQILNIPTRVGDVHNTASTVTPYNPSRIVGSTKPNLPVPQAPMADEGGCGTVGQVIILVIAIIVTYYTCGATSEWLATAAPSAFATSGAAATAGTVAANAVVAGAVGAAAGSIASQTVAVAIGQQKEFSWGQVGMAAIGGAIGGAVSGVSGLSGQHVGGLEIFKSAGVVGRAMITNALTQGVSCLVGQQQGFDWARLTSAYVGAGVGAVVGDETSELLSRSSQDPSVQKFESGLISGVVAGSASAAITGNKVDAQQIAADAFGNALGGSIVDEMSESVREQQARTLEAQQEEVSPRWGAAYQQWYASLDGAPQSNFQTTWTGVGPLVFTNPLEDIDKRFYQTLEESWRLLDDFHASANLGIPNPSFEAFTWKAGGEVSQVDTYKVRKGDSWAKIAKEYYGDERYAAWLMAQNKVSINYNNIHGLGIGANINLPDLYVTDEEDQQLLTEGGKVLKMDRDAMIQKFFTSSGLPSLPPTALSYFNYKQGLRRWAGEISEWSQTAYENKPDWMTQGEFDQVMSPLLDSANRIRAPKPQVTLPSDVEDMSTVVRRHEENATALAAFLARPTSENPDPFPVYTLSDSTHSDTRRAIHASLGSDDLAEVAENGTAFLKGTFAQIHSGGTHIGNALGSENDPTWSRIHEAYKGFFEVGTAAWAIWDGASILRAPFSAPAAGSAVLGWERGLVRGARTTDSAGVFVSRPDYSFVSDLTLNAEGAVTVYRVDTNGFPARVVAGADGTIKVPSVLTKGGNERALFLNFGDESRAMEFALKNRGGNATVTAVEVDKRLLENLRLRSITEGQANLFGDTTSPLRVDKAFSNQFGLRTLEDIQLFRDAIKPGSGKVIYPGKN